MKILERICKEINQEKREEIVIGIIEEHQNFCEKEEKKSSEMTEEEITEELKKAERDLKIIEGRM